MALFEDFLQVIIDGVDVSDYVLAYSRNESICETGTSFTLGFTRKKPDGSILNFTVSDSVVIYEKYPTGDLVLRGYLTSINANANNAELRITGMDKYILLADYFIPTRLETQGESVAYWINYICGLVGLSVQFDTYPGIPTDGGDGNGGTPLGMQRAAESLSTLERKGAVYIRYDSDLDTMVVYTLTDAEPKVTINSSNLITFDRAEGTESTRNVVKVYGGHDYDWLTQQSYAYNATAVATIPELVVDQIFAIATPEIRSQTFANIVAQRILSITATLDDLVVAECAGLYPAVKIANNATISISQGEISYSADRMITSLAVVVSKAEGAKTTFTFGEKCPRITISPPPYFVYATYEGAAGGAAVSYDAGDSFVEFNQGLPASGIPAQSIAANSYNQLMMVTASGIYKRAGFGDVWSRVTALDATYPSNDEGEVQFLPTDIVFRKVEKEGGFLNKFHILGQVSGGSGGLPPGQERWWVYWTPDFGYTWSSMQLYTPGSGIVMGTASGLPEALINGNGITPAMLRGLTLTSGAVIWNVHAHDIEGDINGNVTVLVEGQEAEYTPPDTVAMETFYLSYVSFSAAAWHWAAGTWWMDGSDPYQGNDRSNWQIGEVLVNDGFNLMRNVGTRIGNVSCFSIPNNREIAYALVERTPADVNVARTNGYRATYGQQDVPNWDIIAGASFDTPAVVDSFGLQSYSVLVDYSSLATDDLVRFCVIGASLDTNAVGGDDYPSNSNIVVNCYFFEDDISIPPASGGCSVTNDTRLIGVSSYAGSPLTYTGEGTYGWTAQGGGTAAPTPRSWYSQEPMGQGAQPNCVDTDVTGAVPNFGYWTIIVTDNGHWHGDARDIGWPTPSHPRDWEESGTVGIYVVKVNLTDKVIADISLKQYFAPDFHDPPPDASQPQRDTDIEDYFSTLSMRAMMIQPDFLLFQENWPSHGGRYGHYLTYPGFFRNQYNGWDNFVGNAGQYSIPSAEWAGVRKTPFYYGSSVGYASMGRENNVTEYIGSSDSRILFDNYSEITGIIPPFMPSGVVRFARGHPDFGYCITEARAVASGLGQDPMTKDHTFMWKAQRATPQTFEIIGNSSRFTDPYAQTSIGVDYSAMWDFRTAAGSTAHVSGGAYFDWNWMSG